MKSLLIKPLSKPIQAVVEIPGSVSQTIRALNIGMMTEGDVIITNPAECDDVITMINIIKTLGIPVTVSKNRIIVKGNIRNIKNGSVTLNADISGRTARSIIALLAVVPGKKILNCDEGFKNRPVGDLVGCLKQMGARIGYTEKEGFLPVIIKTSRLHEGTFEIKGDVSSQFISSILMVAPKVGELNLRVEGEMVSKPYVDMTINIMKHFGVEINSNNCFYICRGNQKYKAGEFRVEPDATAASYFWAIAAITKSKIRINNINPENNEGDLFFAKILEKMGCKIRKNREEKWIEVEGAPNLSGIKINMNMYPDIVQSLAVVAAFAKGETVITDITNLKFKETDRIKALVSQLNRIGITAMSENSSLRIMGGSPNEATIDTYGDHRMAMSFAVAGTKIPGIRITDPEVVNKTFPSFWKKLSKLGIKTVEV